MNRHARLVLYEEAAILCFGKLWQSDAARHHGVTVRTMQRWVAGQADVPDRVLTEVLTLVQARAEALRRFAKKMEIELAEAEKLKGNRYMK